jgi:hypothetical protein
MKSYMRIFKSYFVLLILLGVNFQLYATELSNERELMVQKIQHYPYLLAYADDKYRDDEKLVMVAIKKNGRTLEYASKRLQDNEKLVSEAVSSNGGALAYVSSRLQDDDDIVSIAVDAYGAYLQHASKRLQDDDDIVMDALRSNGANLQYASKRLRDDKWYVNLAISNHASALEYASKRLQNDRALVLISVRTYSSNLSYASKALQDDKSLVLEAVKIDGRALRYASKRLKNDKEVVRLAIKNDAQNVLYASSALQKKLGVKVEEDIQIEFSEKVADLESVPLGIKTNLPFKSIKIMQESKRGKSVVGLYHVPNSEPIDYYIALNLSNGFKGNEGSIVIELEDENGKKQLIKKHFFQDKGKKMLHEKYKNSDDALNCMTEQKYKRHIVKLRIKDELAYGAFMVMHPMLREKDAKVLNLDADFIEHVVGKVGKKVVFDFDTSSMLRSDPFFRFTFNSPTKSGKLEITVTDNKGKSRVFYKVYEI